MKYNPKKQAAYNSQCSMHDEEWIASLMRTHYSDLFNYSTRFTPDADLIRDCIQEVFLDLWQRRKTAGEILNPKFYFLRAVKNKILKSLDQSRRHQAGDKQAAAMAQCYEFSIEDIIISREISAENYRRLQSVLASLSKKEKEVIYLKYYQFLNNAQIADLMNISRQSVYNLIYSSVIKLRTCWQREFLGA